MKISGVEPIDLLVLDTSAYSRFRSNDQAAVGWIAAAHIVAVPVTVLGELEAGFAIGRRAAENRAVLNDFLAEPFTTVIETTASVAKRYGSILSSLRAAGTPIPTNDIWIAATALDSGGRLLTFDQHFRKVPWIDSVVLDI